MSEILLGCFLAAILILAALCVALVMFHIQTQRALTATLHDMMEGQADGFSKLLQTALLHLKAPSAEVAMSLQVALEREQALLDKTIHSLERAVEESETKVPRTGLKRVVGYKGPDGKEFFFKTPPPTHVLDGIDKSRLVYAE